VGDDTHQHLGAGEFHTRHVDTFSSYSENETAGSVPANLGALSRNTQQNISSGFNQPNIENIPHSPIIDSAHPWEEVPSAHIATASAETVSETSTQDKNISRYLCEICDKRFGRQGDLKRHLDTKHRLGKDYWVCTVERCRIYGKPVFRKDNLRRHCRKKHPRVDLKKFDL
jgi:uncharacterized Zn-finger protein